MFKISIGVFFLILGLVFGNALVVSGQGEGEMCVPTGTIYIEPPDTVEAKRPPAYFPHSIHFNYQCQTCHHKWEVEEPIANCTTSGCHDLDTSPTKSQNKSTNPELAMAYYKTAYHKLCITCHKQINAENKKLEMSGRVIKEKLPGAGPSSCIGCHVPEE